MKESRFASTDKILIAGPCAAESLEQLHPVAKCLSSYKGLIFRAGLWKPRTRPGAFEGVGELGLRWLNEIRETYGLKIATEVASPNHVEKCMDYGVDALWIGARTTTNPFSVEDIARSLSQTDVPIFVKNPLNPDVKLWIGAIERLLKNGCRNVYAVHRGFSLADNGIYRQSPLWEVAIEFRRLLPDVKLICDPSHIAGKKELVFDLAQTAMNLNYDGLMIETHPSPATAKTDSQQQLLPSELFELLNGLQLFDGKEDASSLDLEILRKRIDEIDSELVKLFSKRMSVVREIAQIKNKNNISALQMHRWDKVLNDRMMQAEKLNINKEFVKEIFEQIHKESLSIQDEIMRKD